jgi:hypothetical protein
MFIKHKKIQQLFQLEYSFIYLKNEIMFRKLMFDNRLSWKKWELAFNVKTSL